MSHGHHHSHGHTHDYVIHPHSHAEQLRHEYHNYCYLFAVSLVAAVGEFLIALLLAHSVSAQADAIHALTHVALIGLAFWISRQIYTRHMNPHRAHDYREKFIIFYVLLVFLGLVWISYMSIVKLLSSEIVVSSYMLASVSVGLCGNIIALFILKTISRIHGNAYTHTAHQWLRLDTWGDFIFSVIVLITSLAGILFSALPIKVIDPIISIGAAVWIGWSGIQILRKKTI